MKKVLFTIGSLAGGGAERVISVLANRFCQTKFDVYILQILENKVGYELNDNIHVLSLELGQQKGIQRNFVRVKKIRKIITNIDPDIVISFLSIINISTIISLIGKKYPIIVSERSDPRHEPKKMSERLIRDILYTLSPKVYFVFQTSYAKKCFSNKVQRRSRIIYNPIRDNLPIPFNGIRQNKIVAVARLQEDKNYPLLLTAFSKFRNQHNDYALHIYGVGPLQKQLEALCKQLHIESYVYFHGFANDVDNLINDAKMFILPSNYEGISNAMLESLALGIPTICTDCPAYGAREFIDNGNSGFIVDLNNCDQLLDRMNTLADNNELCKKFTKNSIKIVNRISEGKITQEWIDFIQEIINE